MLITPDPADYANCQEHMPVTPTDVNYAPVKHCRIIIFIIIFKSRDLFRTTFKQTHFFNFILKCEKSHLILAFVSYKVH